MSLCNTPVFVPLALTNDFLFVLHIDFMQHIRSLLVSFISKQFSLKRDQRGLLSAQLYIHTINRNDVFLYAHHTIWKAVSACFVQFWSGQTLTANILNILVTVPGVQCSILPLPPLFSLLSCSIQLPLAPYLSCVQSFVVGGDP